MNILLLDNCGMNYSDRDYFIDTRTGEFAKELKELGHEVTFYGQRIYNQEKHSHIFGVCQNGMKAVGVRRRRSKFILYIMTVH